MKKTARTSLFVMGEKVLKMVTYLISGTIIARICGPEIFGLYSTALAVAVIFTTLSALGLNTLLVKEYIVSERAGRVLINALILRLQAACLLGLVTVLVLLFMLDIPPGTSALAGLLVPIALFQLADSLFEARGEMDRVLYYKGVGYVLGLCLKIAVVLTYPEVNAVMAAHVAEMALILGGAALAVRRSPVATSRADTSPDYRRALLKKSFPLLLSSGAVILYMKVDQAMVLRLSGSEDAGVYAAAARLCEALFILSVPLIVAIFPRLVALYEDRAAFDRLLGRAFGILVGVGICVALCAVVAAGFVVQQLYGSAFEASAQVIRIYALSVPLVFFSDIFSRWLIITDNLKLSAKRHFLGLGINVGLNFALIPSFGPNGAAVASVAGYAFAGVLFAMLHPKARPFFNFVRSR